MTIVAWIVAGSVAGWLAAGAARGDNPLGVTGHIVLGIIGAVSGGFIAGAVFDVSPFEGALEPLSTIAAIVAAAIVALSADALVERSSVERDVTGHAR